MVSGHGVYTIETKNLTLDNHQLVANLLADGLGLIHNCGVNCVIFVDRFIEAVVENHLLGVIGGVILVLPEVKINR